MRTLKFTPETWADFKKDTQVLLTEADAHVKLAEPGAIYCEVDGKWQLVHFGTEFKIEFPAAGYNIKSTVAGSLYVSMAEPIEDENEVLTNFDKRPGLSGAEQMVMKMIKEQKIKERSEHLKRQQADLEQAQKRIAKGLTDKLPKGVNEPEPEPEAVVEPDPEETPDPATALAG